MLSLKHLLGYNFMYYIHVTTCNSVGIRSPDMASKARSPDSMTDRLLVSPTIVPSESVTMYSLSETRITVSHKFHLYTSTTDQ